MKEYVRPRYVLESQVRNEEIKKPLVATGLSLGGAESPDRPRASSTG